MNLGFVGLGAMGKPVETPRPGSMTGDEFLSNVLACARSEDGAELPFERWRPVLRRSFVRSLALQAVISLLPRSPSGPSSPDTTTSRILRTTALELREPPQRSCTPCLSAASVASVTMSGGSRSQVMSDAFSPQIGRAHV